MQSSQLEKLVSRVGLEPVSNREKSKQRANRLSYEFTCDKLPI